MIRTLLCEIGTITVLAGMLSFLYLQHGVASGIILVGGGILLLSTLYPTIDQINVHLEDDLGLGPDIGAMIPKLVIQFQWQNGRKRIGSDDLTRIEKVVRGRQFPITLQLGRHKATVVVDCCFDGVPKLISDVERADPKKFNPSTNSRSGLAKA